MTDRVMPRRSTIAAALLPMAGAAALVAVPGADAAAQPAATSPGEVVKRWSASLAGTGPMPMAEAAQPDIVIELHGAGSMRDGKPRVLRGAAEVGAWFEAARDNLVAPPVIRPDRVIEQGDTVVVISENTWTMRPRIEGGEPVRRTQAVFAAYTVRDGKIARIVRFTDMATRPQG